MFTFSTGTGMFFRPGTNLLTSLRSWETDPYSFIQHSRSTEKLEVRGPKAIYRSHVSNIQVQQDEKQTNCLRVSNFWSISVNSCGVLLITNPIKEGQHRSSFMKTLITSILKAIGSRNKAKANSENFPSNSPLMTLNKSSLYLVLKVDFKSDLCFELHPHITSIIAFLL